MAVSGCFWWLLHPVSMSASVSTTDRGHVDVSRSIYGSARRWIHTTVFVCDLVIVAFHVWLASFRKVSLFIVF